ncbi:MAG: DUF1846 family protein, partial [Oscillospiraceae bacterium]|nr:DUF1846 family protein [Oscillospiraceae bacterium]
VLRLRDEFMSRNFMVGSVVITHYNGQHAADQFRHRLEREGIKQGSAAEARDTSSLSKNRSPRPRATFRR